MNNMDMGNVLTALGTIIGYFVTQKFFFPQIVNLWNWITNVKRNIEDRTIDTLEEIHKVKVNETEHYEKTFNTLLDQIQALEEELKTYSKELQKLRSTILSLNAKLYDKQLIIGELQRLCCANENCPNRVACKNYMCEIDLTNETNK